MKSEKNTSGKAAGPSKTDAISLKERIRAFSNLPSFFKLVWQASSSITIISCVLRIIRAVIPVSILYVSKLIIDQVALYSHTPNGNYSFTNIWQLAAIAFGLVVLSDVIGRLLSFFDSSLDKLFSNYTVMKIMRHAATLDLEQFEDPAFYDKLERARAQTGNRTQLLSQVLGQVQDLITIAFLSAGLIAFSPWLMLILLVSVMPVFFGEYYFNGKNYLLIRSQTAGIRELDYIRYVGASFETAKEVKVFGLSDFLLQRFTTLSTKFYIASRALGLKRVIVGTSLGLFGSVGYLLAFIIIIRSVQKGSLSIGGLTFLIGSFQQMKALLGNMMTTFSSVSQGTINLKDFFDFFKITPTIVSKPNSLPFPNTVKDGFKFENVGFKYVNSGRWAVRHLNFTIGVDEKLALVGENGAGKTTLVKLLTRLYDPTEGRILLDGINLKDYSLVELRSKLGIIFQDFYHYQMTCSRNIAVGNIDERENNELIERSAKKSFANKIIEALPGKYSQMLGKYFDSGIELSGGEWQKIALARAYMREAPLIILDEPTAALDARSEYKVFQDFSELIKGKSAVLISHRFSTVRMVDRILVLEKGELIENGSHEELLKLGGRYAELFELQAMGYK